MEEIKKKRKAKLSPRGGKSDSQRETAKKSKPSKFELVLNTDTSDSEVEDRPRTPSGTVISKSVEDIRGFFFST